MDVRGPTAGGTARASVRAPPLIGRREQLTEITERLAPDRFQVVLVMGGPGLGKTRLASEALATRGDDATCLAARCHRWGATSSFGAWVDALDPHLRSRSDEELRHLTRATAPEVAALFPALRAVAAPLPRDPQRGRMLEALVGLCAGLSGERPLLIAIDDIHLADSSSWEAVRYVGRRLPDAPIGIIATARPAELGESRIGREVLLGLEDDDQLHRVELRPLARHEVAELAHALLRADPRAHSAFVPESLITWLTARTLGHPLFIIGLLGALMDEGADLIEPGLDRIPETLRERITLELVDLPTEVREVLELLAVLDRGIALDDLEELTGTSPTGLSEVLEILTQLQLVSETAAGPVLSYEVAHPVIQDAIYDGIGLARRRGIHAAVARMRLAAGQLGLAAAHFARTGRLDDEALDTLFRAIAQAEDRGLYREALAVLAVLSEVLPRGDERWARVLDALAWRSDWVLSHLAEGDAATAVTAVRRIIEVLDDRADHARRAIAWFHLATLLSFGLGRLDEAEEACRRAVDLFAASGEVIGELIATNELAWIRGGAGHLAEQVELSQRVLRVAEDQGHAQPAVQAAGTGAFALALMGRFDDAEAWFDRSLGLAESAGYPYRVAWTTAQHAHMLGLAGRPEDAISVVEQTLDADPAAADAIALEVLAHCHWLRGDLADGVTAVERSAVRRPVLGSRRRAWAVALAARMYAEMGQGGRARSGLELAEATFEGRELLAWNCWCGWTRGFLAWQDGDTEVALNALDAVAARLRAMHAAALEPLLLVDIMEVAADAGVGDVLDGALERLVEIAARLEAPLQTALAGLGRAERDLVTGALDDAAEHAARAHARLEAAGYHLFAGRAQLLRGRALEGDDRRGAVAAFEAAARTFDACGASWRRDRALAMLARLGSRGRRASAAIQGPGSLTGREREVVTLAAKGHTAREIGARLYISKRTVESHLANAYPKLGLASKRELIQRADQLGIG